MAGNDELAGQDLNDRSPRRRAALARKEEEQRRRAALDDQDLEIQAQEDRATELQRMAELDQLAAAGSVAGVGEGLEREKPEVCAVGADGLQDVLDRAAEVERASVAYADAQTNEDAAISEAEARATYDAAVKAHERALARERQRAAMRGLFDQPTQFALAQKAAVADAERAWEGLGETEVKRVSALVELRAAQAEGAWLVEDAQVEAVQAYDVAESRAVALGVAVAELPRAKASALEVHEPAKTVQPEPAVVEPRELEPEPASAPSVVEPSEKPAVEAVREQAREVVREQPGADRQMEWMPSQERVEEQPDEPSHPQEVRIAPPTERESRRAAKRQQRKLNQALARGRSIDGLIEGGPMRKTGEKVTLKPGGLLGRPRPVRKEIVRTNGRYTEVQTWEKPGRLAEWRMTRRSLTENTRERGIGRGQTLQPVRTTNGAAMMAPAKVERPVQQTQVQQALARETAYQAQLARERAEARKDGQEQETVDANPAAKPPMTSAQRAAARRARDARAQGEGGLSR